MPDALMPEFILSLVVSSIVTTLCGAVIGYLISKVKYAATNHKEQVAALEEQHKRDEKIDLITLRMAIYDEHFDTDEKLEAYVLYRELGGNHRTKWYMDELVGMDVDVFLTKHPIG